MIFVVWSDHDGAYVEKYHHHEQEEAEAFVLDLRNDSTNGRQLIEAIKGDAMSVKDIEIVSKIELVEDQEG